jgi:hypothetical protein
LLEFLLTAKSSKVADEERARYFKRLRCRSEIVVLESLNPDGTTAAEVRSVDGALSAPRIAEALEVVGVLFELPNAKDEWTMSRSTNCASQSGDRVLT